MGVLEMGFEIPVRFMKVQMQLIQSYVNLRNTVVNIV